MMRAQKIPIVISTTLLIAVLSLFLSNGRAENSPQFDVSPYLTELTHEQAVINWRLREKGNSSIRYTIGPEKKSITIYTKSSIQHKAVLKNLKPGSQYKYSINDLFESSFTTPNQSDRLNFVALGHTHGTEQFSHYPDRLLVAKVNALRPEFLIHMGDATYYSIVKDFKRHFFDLFGVVSKSIPIYISPGNHDSGWPFIYGPNLNTFKELFPYPYPKQIKANKHEAFYSIIHSNVQFLFISYTSDLSSGSHQIKWLEKKLRNSKYDFNIIVFGGGQSGYYDRSSFLEFLSQFKVDLILNGDSIQPKVAIWEEHGIPVAFAGTGGSLPHPFFYIEKEKHYLTIKLLDAIGNLKQTQWIYNQRTYKAKKDLLKNQYRTVRKTDGFTLIFKFDKPLISSEVGGLQFIPKAGEGRSRNVYFYAYLSPDDVRKDYPNEGGLRTQYQMMDSKDRLVTLPFPGENPFKGGSYRIKEIKLTFSNINEQEELEFERLYLY